MDRRDFLKTAAGGVALTGFTKRHAAFHTIKQLLPGRATRTPIKHIVIVMQENRSVDHFLGWYGKENPNFDGRQAMTVPDLRKGHAGQTRSTAAWGAKGYKNFHGRTWEDPSHSWDGGRAEFAGGRVNGWLDPKTGNDEFCLAYYDDVDIPVWAQLVRDYQAYDRWHCSLLGPTEPNRYYLHSGQAGGHKDNSLPPEFASTNPEWRLGWNWATMWDLYDRFNVSAANYFCNLPELAYWGARHVNRMRHISHYFEACETGTLPQVSFVNPFYNMNQFGNDDHPSSDIRLGQAFLSDVTEAFMNSRHYKQGALIVTYDEWGGFFDHVPPPRLPDDRATNNNPGGPDDFGQLGFRVPSSIVSPWTHRPGAVDHTLYEHTSINKFIADNWNLPYLTKRVRNTNSIEHAFGGFRNFSSEPHFAPYDAPLKAWTGAATAALAGTVTNPGVPFSTPVPTTPVDLSGVRKLQDIGWFDKFKIRTDWKFEDSFMKSRPELLADVTRG